MSLMQRSSSRNGDLLAVIFTLLFPAALTLVYFTLLAEASVATQYLAYGSLKLIQFGFPLFWVLAIQGRQVRPHAPQSAGLLAGVAFGAVVLTAMWTVYSYVLLPSGLIEAARVPVQDKIGGFGVDTFAAYLVLAGFYSLIHSLLEEYYWRWFVFAQLRRLTSLSPAIFISSVGFMAHHVILVGTFFGWGSPLAWSLAAAVALGGAVWAWMYHRWGSLYPVWFGHLLVDAGIFWVGYDLVGGLSS
jgi:membrane protease YdiL (CAAX protease family)